MRRFQLSLAIFAVATGFTSAGLIWLSWKLLRKTKISDYSRLAVDEALNDGCIRVISGCFEQEHKFETLNDSHMWVIANYCSQTLEENI